MSRGYLYLEALVGLSLFTAGIVGIAGFYLGVLHLMQRHETRERAVFLAEQAAVDLRQLDKPVMSELDDLRLELVEQEQVWQGKLRRRELRVYYRQEQEPIYNLLIYE